MKLRLLNIFLCSLFMANIYGQETYELDPKFPVHDLNKHLQVIADSIHTLSPAQLINEPNLTYVSGAALPQPLKVGVTYWGKLNILTKDSLLGWTLHFEDKMIGPPAWTKSNGKVDVYAYSGNTLLFHKKTGVEYSKKSRDIKENWVLNRIRLDELPLNTSVTLIIRAQGNSFGYPAYFNLSARSAEQAYYHQIYQFNNSFNIFMFGVTLIIFLYHVLQFIYLRQRIFFWFSLWLLFCTLTQAMTIGLFIGNMPSIRYPVWMFIANGIFFTFWFFGRSFIDSKTKFPILDKCMIGLALLLLLEIVITDIYVITFSPQTYYTGVGIHYQLLNVYTILSLALSIIITFKKDLFARYFGIGSVIGSLALIVGTLWAMGIISPPFRLDPYATGIFLQIVIYSFGIAYRQRKITLQAQEEKLQAQRSIAEIERMKDLDEMKTRFFANISHEFRTPLSLITGPINHAHKKSGSQSESIGISRKTYQVIKKNAQRLQDLVDQLLDLSKLESGTITLSLTQGNIVKFIRSMVFSFESMAERKNISLNTNFPIDFDTAYFDTDKLEKIVTNVLSNAFKYTPEGGAVTVDVQYTESHITMQISDTGKGVQKEDVQRIFDRFYRVEGSEEKGSGIGLALTKELVDLHNGQISVNSNKGKGTTFKIRLPYTLKHLPQAISVGGMNEDARSQIKPLVGLEIDTTTEATINELNGEVPIVLVVEDNSDLRDFIAEILGTAYRVLKASDGLQGERMAFEHIPDIIISDVMMPKKDGYELCHTIKNNQKTSHIPIIMLTAKAGKNHKMEGLSQGADAYLIKPFEADELEIRIKNLIAARKKIWQHFKSSDLILIEDLPLKSIDDAFLQKVVATIKKNLDNEQLSVEDLSTNVGFSRSQLHRKLKALTNKSANQLIVEIRLNEARRMLESRTGSISEIAYAVGYSNMSYFTKSFKEKFGLLPSKV